MRGFYGNQLILIWNYSKKLDWKCFLTSWFFTSFWPKPVLLSQCLPDSMYSLKIAIYDTFAQEIQMHCWRWCFVQDTWISCTFKDAAVITLSQAPVLTVNSRQICSISVSFRQKHQSAVPPWWEKRLYLMYYTGFRAELIVYSWNILGTHVGNTCWDSGNSREHICRLTTTVVSLYGSEQILKARAA